MSTGLIQGQVYPTISYGTNNVNATSPAVGPPTPYGKGVAVQGRFTPTSPEQVATQSYPLPAYGVSADTGTTQNLSSALIKGQAQPPTPYAISDDTGVPGNLRGTLISGDAYPPTPYGKGNQTTASQPAWPVHTFQINLKTVDFWEWELPNRITLDGNETSTEAANQTATRSTWLPSLFSGVENIAHHDGDQITVYGLKALYLKNTYCNANDPNAVLTLIS